MKRIEINKDKIDEIYHPNVLHGGIWLNNGFSSSDEITDDFIAEVDESIIEYK